MFHAAKMLLVSIAVTIALAGSACSSLTPATPLPPTLTASPMPVSTPTLAPSPTPPPTGTSTPATTETTSPTDPPTLTLTATLTATATVTQTATRVAVATAVATKLPVVNLNACATIWEPGYYHLTTNIKTPGTDCFYVQSNNVVFDCDNHTIEGNNYTGYAFFVRKWGFPFQQTATNVEIKNCTVLHHRTGIFIGGGNNIYVHHNNLSENKDTVNKERFGVFLGMPEADGGLTEGGGLRFDTVKGGRAEYNTTNHEAIGIDVRDSDHITVANNTASGNSAWGISLLNTSYSQVSNNTTQDNIRYCAWGDGTVGRGCDAGGIMLQDGASHNTVSGNSVLGENGNGIFIKAHGSRCGDDNLIQNNKIVDAVYNAIEFSFCSGNRVIGNDISGSYDAIWFGFSTNTEIRNNVIRNMTNHGIISYNSHNSVVAGNQIANSREGIFFYWDTWDPKRFYFLTPSPDNYASRDNLIQSNTLTQNSAAGIHLSNATDNRLLDNTFSGNGRDLWIEGKSSGNVTGEVK